MKRYNQTERLAFNHAHPKQKPKSYSLWYGGQCLSQPFEYGLCKHLKNQFMQDVRFPNKTLFKIKPNY